MNLDCADSPANALSTNPDVFLDGRGVVYESLATNLLNSNQDMGWQGIVTDTNGLRDVFESRLKPKFVRGDVDPNGEILQNDATTTSSWLFLGQPRPVCLDAADTDDSGSINLTDAVIILNFLNTGSSPPECPFGVTVHQPRGRGR